MTNSAVESIWLVRARHAAGRAILGPWPIRPWLTFVVLFWVNLYAANFFLDVNLANAVTRMTRAIPVALGFSLAVTLVLVVSNSIGKRSGRSAVTRRRYLITIFVAGSVFALVGLLWRVFLFGFPFTLFGFPISIFRGVVVVGLIQVVAGINDARLREQVDRASTAYDEVIEQRRIMVGAEERARELVARFLHDRVQASIVAISLQLGRIRSRAPEPLNGELASVIDELEQLRSVDVRTASRRLSPDISVSGLDETLRELFATYGDSVSISLHRSSELDDWAAPSAGREGQCLAVYRIVEQALLNAAVHGRPLAARVDITQVSGDVLVHVADDGSGLLDGPLPQGAGTAIITAWVSLLKGTWSLTPAPGGGAMVTVRFPRHD